MAFSTRSNSTCRGLREPPWNKVSVVRFSAENPNTLGPKPPNCLPLQ